MKVLQITGEDVEGLKKFDNNCVPQLKYDGSKYFLHVINEKAFALTSKRISVKTGELNEKLANIPFLSAYKFPFKKLTIIVVEIVAEHLMPEVDIEKVCGYVSGLLNGRSDNPKVINNDLSLLAHSFLYYEGVDVRGISYGKKYYSIQKKFPSAGYFGENINKRGIFAVKNIPLDMLKVNELKFLSTMINVPGKFQWEGLVIKDMGSMKMMKLIKVITVDCIIIGFDNNSTGKYAKKGWMKSIRCGVIVDKKISEKLDNKNIKKKGLIKKLLYNGAIIEIAKAGGMNEVRRADFSIDQERFIGDIVEIKCKGWNGERLRQPRFGRIRHDQAIGRCNILQLEESWVK